MVEHAEDMRTRMAASWPLVREHMQEAQEAQAQVYNRGAQQRDFQPGDKALVLVPTSECKFLAQWKDHMKSLTRWERLTIRSDSRDAGLLFRCIM